MLPYCMRNEIPTDADINSLTCPITYELFFHPVTTRRCQHTFEMKAIHEWLDEHKECPLCRAPLSKNKLYPNIQIEQKIKEIIREVDCNYEPFFPERHIKEMVSRASLGKILNLYSQRLNRVGNPDNLILTCAIIDNRIDIVRVLLKLPELDINAPGIKQWTPLHYAAALPRPTILQLLLEKGARPDVSEPEYHITPLMVALSSNRSENIKLLLESGKDLAINQRRIGTGQTALHLAIEKCDINTFKSLLQVEGINVNLINTEGETPLFIASKLQKFNKVAALLDHPNIQVESTDYISEGNTLLHLAVIHNQYNVVKKLLALDIDSTFPSLYEQKTPLEMAEARGFRSIRDLLLSRSIIIHLFDEKYTGLKLETLSRIGKEPLNAIYSPVECYYAPQNQQEVHYIINHITEYQEQHRVNLHTNSQWYVGLDANLHIQKLNRLFSVLHKGSVQHQYVWQGMVRQNAFDCFKKTIADLDATSKLERLQWARNQSIFREHRSWCCLFRIGRTRTVIEIDRSIRQIRLQSR